MGAYAQPKGTGARGEKAGGAGRASDGAGAEVRCHGAGKCTTQSAQASDRGAQRASAPAAAPAMATSARARPLLGAI